MKFLIHASSYVFFLCEYGEGQAPIGVVGQVNRLCCNKRSRVGARARARAHILTVYLAVILILVSQRADDDFVRLFGTARMKAELAEQEQRQRGQAPSKLELLVVLYVIGFMWEEIQEIFAVGMQNYLRNMWNFIDFLRNSLYVSVMCLR